MSEIANFRLKLTGDTADHHQFQGYDGYMAMAGFAWTLALVTHYAETGKIRQRGEFLGRDAVRSTTPSEGSILVDFSVWIQQDPARVLNLGVGTFGASAFLYDLVKRVIDRNLGQNSVADTQQLAQLLKAKGGDVEALVARVEPAIRQTHAVIGRGANEIQIIGGHNIINTYNEDTRNYVKLNIEEEAIRSGEFSVAAFNVNSGYGSVFDFEIGRTVPISMSRETLRRTNSTFTWALDQYANKTGGKIFAKYTRILAMDNTPKRYIIIHAERAEK